MTRKFSWLVHRSPQDIDLLFQDQQLGLKSGPRSEQIGDDANNEATSVQHRALATSDSHPLTSRIGFSVGTSRDKHSFPRLSLSASTSLPHQQ
jgi:hypothetical protein